MCVYVYVYIYTFYCRIKNNDTQVFIFIKMYISNKIQKAKSVSYPNAMPHLKSSNKNKRIVHVDVIADPGFWCAHYSIIFINSCEFDSDI